MWFDNCVQISWQAKEKIFSVVFSPPSRGNGQCLRSFFSKSTEISITARVLFLPKGLSGIPLRQKLIFSHRFILSSDVSCQTLRCNWFGFKLTPSSIFSKQDWFKTRYKDLTSGKEVECMLTLISLSTSTPDWHFKATVYQSINQSG